jgi:hypothetical protein
MAVVGRGLYLLIVAWIVISVVGFYLGLYEGVLG